VAETDSQRRKREQQRGLFDGAAGLYDATRQSYPAQIVDAILTTAATARAPLCSRSAAAPASSPGNWRPGDG